MLVFEERGKPVYLGATTRTNNKLNPHMTPSTGVEPEPHLWEASALITTPSLPLQPPTPLYKLKGPHRGILFHLVFWGGFGIKTVLTSKLPEQTKFIVNKTESLFVLVSFDFKVITAPKFNNMRTLDFKTQPTICLFYFHLSSLRQQPTNHRVPKLYECLCVAV